LYTFLDAFFKNDDGSYRWIETHTSGLGVALHKETQSATKDGKFLTGPAARALVGSPNGADVLLYFFQYFLMKAKAFELIRLHMQQTKRN
jgi:hypothetical protein